MQFVVRYFPGDQTRLKPLMDAVRKKGFDVEEVLLRDEPMAHVYVPESPEVEYREEYYNGEQALEFLRNLIKDKAF